MESAYSDFLEQPTLERYLHVQQMALAKGVRQDALHLLIALIRSKAYADAAVLQDEMGATWLLSPSFHLWSARLAESMGDEEAIELAEFQFHACLTGLFATGDGSRQSPYRITYTSDVADLLTALGKKALAQHLVRRVDGCCDLVSCTDGSELLFARPDLDDAHEAAVAALRSLKVVDLPSLN